MASPSHRLMGTLGDLEYILRTQARASPDSNPLLAVNTTYMLSN